MCKSIIKNSFSRGTSIIEIRDLHKKFDSIKAVDGLTLKISKGEILGFLGPNGAGKTTTINVICGLSQPTSGEIIFSDNKFKNIKNHIGFCPQENIFWPKLTCLEQLIFMSEMYGKTGKSVRDKSKELLELLGLSEKSNVLANTLSGGMKRRLNICLALIHDPEILILDEPEAGLDPQSRILVRNFIKSLSRNRTIILTTHNMDEADRLADRVAIIDYGKLLSLDTPENLKKSIGEGDILEIELLQNGEKNKERLIKYLSQICDKVQCSDTALILKSKNMVEKISVITDRIKEMGFGTKEIKLRENTLEDVFIHLTGRKLRE